MLMTACSILIALAASGDEANWLTISPARSQDQSTVILPPTPIASGHTYLLAWDMRVEGEKIWRFRADFAGVTVRFTGAEEYTPASQVKQTSCWQTLDWQRAWLVIEPSPRTHTIDATMAIVSKEDLPGRFRVRNVRLIDLSDPIPLAENEGELHVAVVGDDNKPLAARVYVVNDAGEGIVPPYTYAYTQGMRCFELIDPRLARLALPAGRYTVRAMKGFEYAVASETVTIETGQRKSVTLAMRPQIKGFDRFLYSAVDHHTHLYRHGGSLYPMMDAHDVLGIAEAEGLTYLPFQGEDKALAEQGGVIGDTCGVVFTRELTRDFWGHICPIYNTTTFFGVGPNNASAPIWDIGSAWPMNMDYIAGIRTFGHGAVTYAHPYGPLRAGSEFESLADPKAGLIAREWPIDLALGVPCAIDMLTKEDARGDFDLKLRDYMRALNLGFRCGVTGSTDFHLDQGREPIGGLRTYVRGAGGWNWPAAALGYGDGKTFATNGPLVEVGTVVGGPGDTMKFDRPGYLLMVLRAESLWGITSAKIWLNGKLYAEIPAVNGAIVPETPTFANFGVPIERSGWMLVTVEGPPSPDVMSSPEGKPCVPGQFAITSPIYFEFKDEPLPPDPEAARYFADWCDAVRKGFDTLCAQHAEAGITVPDDARRTVYERIDKAKSVFMAKAK